MTTEKKNKMHAKIRLIFVLIDVKLDMFNIEDETFHGTVHKRDINFRKALIEIVIANVKLTMLTIYFQTAVV